MSSIVNKNDGREKNVDRAEPLCFFVCFLKTDRRCILLKVCTVGQVSENGVHVLDISDRDSQVGQPGERSLLVLILKQNKSMCQHWC